ncbi:hypothetical protein [Alienimonas sp. DA493]|uniref:hypothetical protein n=1 Tax=Alienimonas sp. DA493 TaxID=3373605 RepID=UPI0037549BEC
MPDLLILAAGVISALVAVLAIAVRLERTAGEDWRERWPAISDAEFLARCSPGVNPRTALTVRRIVAEQRGVPYERVHPEQRFVEDLHAD